MCCDIALRVPLLQAGAGCDAGPRGTACAARRALDLQRRRLRGRHAQGAVRHWLWVSQLARQRAVSLPCQGVDMPSQPGEWWCSLVSRVCPWQCRSKMAGLKTWWLRACAGADAQRGAAAVIPARGGRPRRGRHQGGAAPHAGPGGGQLPADRCAPGCNCGCSCAPCTCLLPHICSASPCHTHKLCTGELQLQAPA